MSADTDQVLLVVSTLPDEDSAKELASALVESRLAACVNVLAPCASVYRWQGAVENATEIPVIIKTTAKQYAELESMLRARHPYELPEILAVRVSHGLPDYLDWVVAQTT